METTLSLNMRRQKVIREFFPKLGDCEMMYKKFHKYPELPCQERDTASRVAHFLRAIRYDVQIEIGGHSVVGIFKNGHGRNVLLRSELDALPIKEKTGLPYASKVEQVDADGIKKAVMHADAHDMDITCLLGAAVLLKKAHRKWSGTLIVLFQPNGERLLGAKAMVKDKLFGKIPLPDVCLAQHCVPTKSGTIAVKPGRVLGCLDSLDIRVYGRSAHGATPHLGINPITISAVIIAHLQTIATREMDPKEPVVIGCGKFHAGTDPSVIPEYADFTVDVRTYTKRTQTLATAAVKGAILDKCKALGCPVDPRIRTSSSTPSVDNDIKATSQFTESLEGYYGRRAPEVIQTMQPEIIANDFALLSLPPHGKPIPYVYWNIGTVGISPPSTTKPVTWSPSSHDIYTAIPRLPL